MSIPIILDCDPGHDDAIALLLALASPELDLLGVTTVHGNQTLEKTTANALRVLDLVGRADVPVAAGADRPLVRELTVASHVHGDSGLDGPALPPAGRAPLGEHAVDFMERTIAASPTPVTLDPDRAADEHRAAARAHRRRERRAHRPRWAARSPRAT